MSSSRALIALTVTALTVSLAPAVYAQRGKPATPPGHANAPRGNPNAAKADQPPKPADFSQRIASHPQLASRLQALLPPNMTLADAAAGFKNQGQFIAALHVSKNLDIPFDQLKLSMTGPDPKSLGQSIKTLRPTADADGEVKTAERQATDDERATNQ